jgi:hypothetical protein
VVGSPVLVGGAEALPKSGFTGNPPTVDTGVNDFEKALNGLEPKAEPPGDGVLLEPNAPPPEQSPAKPPIDDGVLDPNVPVDPNALVGLTGVDFTGEAVVLSDETAPNTDVSSTFFPNEANGEPPILGLPNVNPLTFPDPKVEGLKLDPNNFEFVVFADGTPSFVDSVVAVSAGVTLFSRSSSLFSSTTTHEAFSGVWGGDILFDVADEDLVMVTRGSFGRSAVDPNTGEEKYFGSFMC